VTHIVDQAHYVSDLFKWWAHRSTKFNLGESLLKKLFVRQDHTGAVLSIKSQGCTFGTIDVLSNQFSVKSAAKSPDPTS
jgi:hypothetical protein